MNAQVSIKEIKKALIKLNPCLFKFYLEFNTRDLKGKVIYKMDTGKSIRIFSIYVR